MNLASSPRGRDRGAKVTIHLNLVKNRWNHVSTPPYALMAYTGTTSFLLTLAWSHLYPTGQTLLITVHIGIKGDSPSPNENFWRENLDNLEKKMETLPVPVAARSKA
jgi:hypothetical protein